MTPEKWEQIKGQLQDSFGEIEFSREKLSGSQVGEAEIALFNGPLGRMKLEYITMPVILDKKTHTSRRIGANVGVEYVYSEDEFMHKLKAYHWNEEQDGWQEIETRNLEL